MDLELKYCGIINKVLCICVIWGLLELKLWLRVVNIVLVFIILWVKCVSLGRYLRYNEWYIFRVVVCIYFMRWIMFLSRCLFFIMLSSVVWVVFLGLSYFFFCCFLVVSFLCLYLWKCLFFGYLCLLVMWWMIDNYFFFSIFGFLL